MIMNKLIFHRTNIFYSKSIKLYFVFTVGWSKEIKFSLYTRLQHNIVIQTKLFLIFCQSVFNCNYYKQQSCQSQILDRQPQKLAHVYYMYV